MVAEALSFRHLISASGSQSDFRKFVEDGATKARSGSPAGQSSPSATPYQKETQAAQQNNA